MNKFFYSITICMLHYNPRHVSSINMPIFRRTNFIITVSGIITLCKRLYSMPDESRLQSRCCDNTIIQYWNKSILWCTVKETSNFRLLMGKIKRVMNMSVQMCWEFCVMLNFLRHTSTSYVIMNGKFRKYSFLFKNT
jgi:hypothetical protein